MAFLLALPAALTPIHALEPTDVPADGYFHLVDFETGEIHFTRGTTQIAVILPLRIQQSLCLYAAITEDPNNICVQIFGSGAMDI